MKTGEFITHILEKAGIKFGDKFDKVEGITAELFKGEQMELVGVKATFRGTGKDDPQMSLELKSSKYLEDEEETDQGAE